LEVIFPVNKTGAILKILERFDRIGT
jgi:hypothetical protein